MQSGQYIDAHILFHKGRADYGSEVIERLAKDLEVSPDLLYQCLRGYRSFKNFDARQNSFPLTWAHLRAAMRIRDEKARLLLIEEAIEQGWNSRQLEIEVRNRNWHERMAESSKKSCARLPFVCLGPFFTYQIIRPETIHSQSKELLLDLGFSHSLEMSLFPDVRYPADTIVTSSLAEKKMGPGPIN